MKKQKDEKDEVEPTEVKPRSGKRRSYPIYYKRRILTLVDQCTEPGEIGRLLRREGLYSSHLTDWRRQQVQGVFDRRLRHRFQDQDARQFPGGDLPAVLSIYCPARQIRYREDQDMIFLVF